MNSPQPLVSIGIPLYQAEEFVPRIIENIRNRDYSNLEFLLSDRHGHDRAMSLLREQLENDSRVRFFDLKDELNWVQNYNFVMENARGKYFRLLAQDDIILRGSLSAAVQRMELNPALAGVDGPVDTIDFKGRVVKRGSEDPPGRSCGSGRRDLLDSLGLFAGWRRQAANLGLIRTSLFQEQPLRLTHTYDLTGLSMRAWLFGLSLRGAFCSLPSYRNQRCVHQASFTTRHFRRSLGNQMLRLLSYVKAGQKIAWNSELGIPIKLALVPLLAIGGLVLLPLLRLPDRLKGRSFRGPLRVSED